LFRRRQKLDPGELRLEWNSRNGLKSNYGNFFPTTIRVMTGGGAGNSRIATGRRIEVLGLPDRLQEDYMA
jgi:hypothetical protein